MVREMCIPASFIVIRTFVAVLIQLVNREIVSGNTSLPVCLPSPYKQKLYKMSNVVKILYKLS